MSTGSEAEQAEYVSRMIYYYINTGQVRFLNHTILCYTTLSCTTLCYTALCYTMLYYAIPLILPVLPILTEKEVPLVGDAGGPKRVK